MSYALLDTNALSDLIRDHAAIKAQVAAFCGFLETSVIVVGEITYGLNRMPAGKRQADYDQRFRDLISTLSIVPITESVARTYGVIKMSCEKSGITLDKTIFGLPPRQWTRARPSSQGIRAFRGFRAFGPSTRPNRP